MSKNILKSPELAVLAMIIDEEQVTARQVSQMLELDLSDAYKFLKSLHEKGFIRKINERENIYIIEKW